MSKRRTLRLTRAEASAIIDLLNFAWADYDAMMDGDLKTYGFDIKWLDAANRAQKKIEEMARPQKPRGKPFARGQDSRRANMAERLNGRA